MERRATRDPGWMRRGYARFQDLSIKKKLLIIMMLITTAALSMACAAFVFIEIQSFKHTMVRDLSALVEVIGHNSSASLLFSDRADAQEALRSLEAKPSVAAAWLFSADGRLLARYARDASFHASHPDPPADDLHRFDPDRLSIHRVIRLNGQDIGSMVLVSDLRTMHLILKRNILTLMCVLLASFLLAYALSSRLRRVISEPVTELARAARRVSREKDYALRVKKHGSDEIGALFEAFNAMLEEIHKRDAELVASKRMADTSALEAGDLLASMEQINLELEREVRERRQIEEELKHHRTQLEHLVERRTEQLTHANLQLHQEIEEKGVAEKNIRQALEEKVVLLGEVHHRVKNNLQIVASLLEMSRHRARTPEAAEQLGEAHAKIFTMALIHSQLYRNDRFDEVNMERHARELFAHLSNLYSKNTMVTARIHMSDLRLPVTQAIPCALILNELLSNAFKYAFDGRDSGDMLISMARDDQDVIHLSVQDDGAGMPQDIDVERTNSLGLKLVRNLVVHQLKGTLSIEGQPGTRVHISFRIPREEA